MMVFPKRLRGLRAATILLAIYALVWITLEGSLGRVILLATCLSLLASSYLAQRYLGGRQLTLNRWLIIATSGGALVGFTCAVLSVLFMAVKTGLHSHGPEFSPREISWIISQTPIWTAAGSLAGLGGGLLAAARFRNN